jgi:hypothetical protein
MPHNRKCSRVGQVGFLGSESPCPQSDCGSLRVDRIASLTLSMNITDQIYMGAEAAMSNALAGVSRQNGVKRLFIVLCAPLLLAVLFYVRHYVF